MSCCSAGTTTSSYDSQGRERSNLIDKELKRQNATNPRQVKILLLGTAESGKTTIAKQMKIIYKNGFSERELAAFKPAIHHNVLDSIRALIIAMDQQSIPFSDEATAHIAEHVLMLRLSPTNSSQFLHDDEAPVYIPAMHHARKSDEDEEPVLLDTETSAYPPEELLSHTAGEMIAKVWNDAAVKALMESQGADFYVIDSARYFLDDVNRVVNAAYTPSVADVLRARVKSTGITETVFDTGMMSIRLLDVGGQRSERRKWIHCFDSVTSILFCAALSEYDQALYEDPAQNRLVESIQLFGSIVTSEWFRNTSMILFLNKIDIFKDKMKRSPLSRFFPEYVAGPDVSKGIKYILYKFQRANKNKVPIYPHITQATDTDNIRVVFAAVRDTIIRNNLHEAGIF